MMPRTPEPELMDEVEQVQAYAYANFEAPHGRFIELLEQRLGPARPQGRALDLGCGPGDITYRFAQQRPRWSVEAIDGASTMIAWAKQDPRFTRAAGQIDFVCARLPNWEPTESRFDLVLSNSLVHHLSDPLDLWRAVQKCAAPNAKVFVMDLQRPEEPCALQTLVEKYAGDEPAILKRDFEASLHAAYRIEEIVEQLEATRLAHLTVEEVSDRHWIAHGTVHPPSSTVSSA